MVLKVKGRSAEQLALDNDSIELPQEIYHKYLKTINGIKFTSREIDIISFFVNGRTTKKIASFFSLSSKTVESHASNIMQKLNCNSRERIIDFIEKSPHSSLLRRYHQSLLKQNAFEYLLKNTPELQHQKLLKGLIVYSLEDADPPFHQLAKHLEIAGIEATIETAETYEQLESLLWGGNQQEYDHTVVFISHLFLSKILQTNFLKKTNNNSIIFILESDSNIIYSEELNPHISIEILDLKKYYSLTFSILEKLLPAANIKKIHAEFIKQYSYTKLTNDNTDLDKALPQFEIDTRKSLKTLSSYWYLVFLIVFSSLIGWFVYKEKAGPPFIRSDIVIPTSYYFLERPELLSEIEKAFERQQGIQIVALVGIGGTGKTTLARHYVRNQKVKFIWEINAETTLSLINSFEKMAYALCKTADDQTHLKNLEDIKNTAEREERILSFVKNKLKLCSSWVLIFDNVEKVIDIQKYLPFDVDIWGNGKVILTTRDSNIRQNRYVSHAIDVKELTRKEKATLFLRVMNYNQSAGIRNTKKRETEKFLEKIPSFPLDVSVAAYYLKATNVSYNRYLENLRRYGEDFAMVQKNILKESGDYVKTRYGIITSSLELLLSVHKDFGELMLLISLLDSQNILRDLLEQYKNNAVIDNFVYHLKKFSLITPELLKIPNSIPAFSIHRSTQEVSLIYLIRSLKLEKDASFFQSFIRILADYVNKAMESDDVVKMKILIRHCSRLLERKDLFTQENTSALKAMLGFMYVYFDDSLKACQVLEESLEISLQNPAKSQEDIAQIYAYLGQAHRNLGNYKKAKECFEKTVSIYTSYLPKTHPKIIEALARLGRGYGSLGNYQKAKELLEEALFTYEKDPDKNYSIIARILSYLGGSIYRRLGEYQKAKSATERALLLCKQHLPKDHPLIALSLIQVGRAYGALEDYQKAKEITEEGLRIYRQEKNHLKIAMSLIWLAEYYRYLGDPTQALKLVEESLSIFEQYFPKNLVKSSEALTQLGGVYKDLGDYQKAEELLKKSLAIFEKYYGKEHTMVGSALMELGQVYFLQGQLKLAETLLLKAFEILQKDKHLEKYVCLESLAEVYLKKSKQAGYKDNQLQDFKRKAFDFLKQAEATANIYFPSDHPSILRITDKLVPLSK